MLGSEMLDVLIGLVTIYLAFALACTAIVEAISAWGKVRSKNLETALNEAFAGTDKKDKSFVDAFYKHPLIQALSKGKDGRPSYIPSEIVGKVVESLVIPGDANRDKGLLNTFLTEANGDKAVFRKTVETYFDAAMDRASGWFKRYTQNIAILISALLVLGANVDTINIIKSLSLNPTARAKMVEIAEQQLKQVKNVDSEAVAAKPASESEKAKNQSDEALQDYNDAVSGMKSAGLQFGWKDCPKTTGAISLKVIGLLISIFAIALGAPFWFDILQKIMKLRSTGAKTDEKKK